MPTAQCQLSVTKTNHDKTTFHQASLTPSLQYSGVFSGRESLRFLPRDDDVRLNGSQSFGSVGDDEHSRRQFCRLAGIRRPFGQKPKEKVLIAARTCSVRMFNRPIVDYPAAYV